jgi:hypothetical protein
MASCACVCVRACVSVGVPASVSTRLMQDQLAVADHGKLLAAEASHGKLCMCLSVMCERVLFCKAGPESFASCLAHISTYCILAVIGLC